MPLFNKHLTSTALNDIVLIVLAWLISASVVAANSLEIEDIRSASAEGRTRVIVDLNQRPIFYWPDSNEASTEHSVIIENVVRSQKFDFDHIFDSVARQLKRNDNPFSMIKAVYQASPDSSLIITFSSTQALEVKVSYLRPSSRYGHRLVFDFERPKIQDATSLHQSKAMIKAKKLIQEGDYHAVLSVLEAMIGNEDLGKDSLPEKQWALEHLGIALLKIGKRARAKEVFQSYLEHYPKSEGSYRVIQYYSSIVSLEGTPIVLKDRKKQEQETKSPFESYGYLGQSYRYAFSKDDNGEGNTDLSSLYTHADVNAHYQGERFASHARINGSYDKDLNSDGGSDDTISRLSYAFLETEDEVWQQRLSVGRQRGSKGGILGRYDGLNYAKIWGAWELSLVAGMPVDRSTDDLFSSDRHFFSANAEFNGLNNELQVDAFFIDQRLESYVDRRALGGEIRYNTRDYQLFFLLDYDIYFSELNAALFNAHYVFESGTQVNLSANYRKSPYLTTRNALIGQQVDTIEEVSQIVTTDKELEALALDRTFDSRYASVNISHPLAEDLELNSTLTLSSLSDAPASGGVAAIEATGLEYYFSNQLRSRSIFSDNDLLTVGLNYGQLANARTYSLMTSWYQRNHQGWSVYPKLTLQRRDYDDNRAQLTLNPSFRSEYKLNKKHSFELDSGAYFYNTDTSLGNRESYQLWYANVSYYYYF